MGGVVTVQREREGGGEERGGGDREHKRAGGVGEEMGGLGLGAVKEDYCKSGSFFLKIRALLNFSFFMLK